MANEQTTIKEVVSKDRNYILTIFSLPNGQYQYIEDTWQLIERTEADEAYMTFAESKVSGFYESADEAEADARATLTWLGQQDSN